MNHLFKIFLTLSVFFLSYNTLSRAQDDILQPNKSRPVLVNDDAGLFSANQRNELEQMLIAYDDSTSTQIAIITVKSLNGYAPGDYAARLGEQWGVGNAENNNGIVILIKPRIGNERGEVYIATGYGVEHILTDARVGRIIDRYMIPYLPDDYYMATRSAVDVIIKMLSGEFKATPEDGFGDISPFIIVLGLIVFFLFFIAKSQKGDDDDDGMDNNRRGGRDPRTRSRGPIFFPPIGGGGFGGRGGSGGGFGGFGGGSFGGGGAGRSF